MLKMPRRKGMRRGNSRQFERLKPSDPPLTVLRHDCCNFASYGCHLFVDISISSLFKAYCKHTENARDNFTLLFSNRCPPGTGQRIALLLVIGVTPCFLYARVKSQQSSPAPLIHSQFLPKPDQRNLVRTGSFSLTRAI